MLRVFDLRPDQHPPGIRIDNRPHSGDDTFIGMAGKSIEADPQLLSAFERRAVAFGHVPKHPHRVDVGDSERRGRTAGLYEQTWRGTAGGDPAIDGTWHDKRRISC